MNLYVVMGVSGVGKTTIGKKLAGRLGIPFFDADDFHPPGNIDKMSSGIPLTDEDRLPWLQQLNQLLRTQQNHHGAILACSALKENYREVLRQNLHPPVRFIFLQAPKNFIHNRMQQRTGHFMPPALLDSQFDVLEEPTEALRVDATQNTREILDAILQQISDID